MKKNAFSLVEISIVLIILGVLVSAVISSTSMVEQAKNRAVISEITKLRIAVDSFKGAYDLQLPGDMSNAYNYWGSDCGGNSLAPTGCNGNNNKYIGFGAHESGVVEVYRFWQHLSLAKMLDYNVTGVVNGSAPLVDDNNLYASNTIKGGLYWPQFPYDWGTGQFYSNDIKNSNVFILGRAHSTIEAPVDKALSPEQAYYIDVKIDDSAPRAGSIKAYNYNNTSNGWHGTTAGFVANTECTSVGNVTSTDEQLIDAIYNLSLESEECILFIDF